MNVDRGALAQNGTHMHRTAQRFAHNRVNDAHAQARSSVADFRAEEGLKEMQQDMLGNSNAVVSKTQIHLTV
jgi:hypothetical protein